MFSKHQYSIGISLFVVFVLSVAYSEAFSACQEGEVKILEYCVYSHKVHYVQPGKQHLLQSVINEADAGDYIILKTGDYEVEATDNQTALRVANKHSLTLMGEDNVWIRTKQGQAAVLTIHASENITLFNLGLIHDVRRGYCDGAVLKLQEAKNVNLTDLVLNGSGTHALFVDHSQHVNMTGGKAVNNTEGVFYVKDSTDLTIKEVLIADNDNSGVNKHGILDIEQSSNVFFTYNTLKNNKNAYFRRISTSQDIEISGNEFGYNQFVFYDANEPDSMASGAVSRGNSLESKTLKIHPDLPDFTFELLGYLKPKVVELTGLKIYRATSATPNEQASSKSQTIQTIRDLDAQPRREKGDNYFQVEDVNFDGYQDLRFLKVSTTAEDTYYRVWLFSPATNLFVENKEFGAIPSPLVDSEKKQILSIWKGSDLNYGTDYYQFIDQRPVLVRQELQDFTKAGTYQLTVKERVGDKLETVKQQLFQGDTEEEEGTRPEIKVLLQTAFLNLAGLNQPNDSCPEEWTRLPDRGIRGLYCLVQAVINYSQLQQAAPVAIFKSGPHSSTALNLRANNDFGHYHPEFVKWLVDNLVLVTQDPVFQQQTQPLYEKSVQRLARTFYEVYHHLQEHPDYLAQEKQAYWEAISSATPPSCCYEAKDYAFHFQTLAENGYDVYEITTAVNFWLRRGLDATDQEWFRGLQKLLEVYDADFLRAREAEGMLNYQNFKESVIPVAQQHCAPQQVLLYSPADNQVTKYPTISQALAAATAGQVIWVCPGTYYETLEVRGRDHLLLYGDKAQVVTRTPKTTVITVIDSHHIEIAGLHLRHEVADSSVENGLVIDHSNRIYLRDNQIEGGYYGLLLSQSHDLEITGNRIQSAQRGIVVEQSQRILLANNHFWDNQTQDVAVLDQESAAVFQSRWQLANEFIHLPGTHVSPSLEIAEEVATRGDFVAQLGLAFYWSGEDDTKAFHWLKMGAEQGHAKAQYHLGWWYYEGRGVSKDPAQAVIWFRKAAQQGVAVAQNVLAGIYLEGRLVPQDTQQAIYWVRKAAQQGLAKAQNNLAGLYYQGQWLPQNFELAALWTQKAAQRGYAPAQYNLSELYRQGLGVSRNVEEAQQWLTKALDQGYGGGRK